MFFTVGKKPCEKDITNTQLRDEYFKSWSTFVTLSPLYLSVAVFFQQRGKVSVNG